MLKQVKNGIRFGVLSSLKISGAVLYPSKFEWLGKEPRHWDEVSVILILNHTSLFEFIYGVTLPFAFLKQMAMRLVLPVADSTLRKPIVNFIYSNLAPKTIALTRKRDESWQKFLDAVDKEDICVFMPEGRMKRLDGRDKDGGKMTVKGGVWDLLERFKGKNLVIVYSGGLHHILPPGKRIPRVFKRLHARAEFFAVNDFLESFKDEKSPRKSLCRDLERRRDTHCPVS